MEFVNNYMQTHGKFSPDNIVRVMLKNTGGCSHVAHYVRVLLLAKDIHLDRWDPIARGSLNE